MASESSNKQDFLRFSAYSFKDLLTRKFSESTKFTDQVYEGSNLAILIDLCSYLFQGLTYCINSAASESMFADTQIYSNISRLVKLIGYNPKGFIPSTATFQFTVDDDRDDMYIPQYASVDTGMTDTQGKKVYYSFAECYDLAGGVNTVTLVNGRWNLYQTVFTANGSNYETFVLDGVESNASKGKYVAHGYIDAYVKRKGKFLKFKGLTDEIFLNNTSKYSSNDDPIDVYKNTDDDRYFSIRLNQDKVYEIKFGNDNNGQKLEAGDQVYVFYLESNGYDATLNIGDVKGKPIQDPTLVVGISDDLLYRKIINCEEQYNVDDTSIDEVKFIMSNINDVTNITASTVAQAEESIEDIKNLAPDYYKLGNRLITKDDFEYYVKNRYKNNIIDVKCQNNWDYISKFYGWLYKLGLTGQRLYTAKGHRSVKDGAYYISQARLVKHDYYFADPADQNNVYLWIKMQNNIALEKQKLDEDLTAIKVLTSEMVFVDPVPYKFAICAAPIERAMKYLVDDSTFDGEGETYLEVTISDNSLYSNTSIKLQINQLFMEFFNEFNMKIGQVVDTNNLLNSIYNINGVQRVRTVFASQDLNEQGKKVYEDRYIDGISFATWSDAIIDPGDDLEVGTSNRSLEDFQFPSFYGNSLIDRIKVIKKSFSNNSTVQY